MRGVSYSWDWLQADVVAGLTTGAVIIPKAMAYAMIAGLPVQVGLYTALIPMVIYAIVGTSRVLSVSTTTTLALLTAAQLGQVLPNGDSTTLLRASATLGLLVGAVLIVACFLRLGFVANFISEPVLVGFRSGIGLVIVVDQIPKVLGIHFERKAFIPNVISDVNSLPRTSIATLAVGLTTIALTGRDGGEAGRVADVHVNVASASTARVQEVHRTLLHVVCDLVERALA